MSPNRYIPLNIATITNKNTFRKMKYDVGLMIDCDAGEKKYKNKVGLSVTKL